MGLVNFLATATATREVKSGKTWFDSGSFGLFLGLSALSSTGAPVSFSLAHDLYYIDHFVPLLTTYYA
jgi:hypothetical protein